MTRLRPTPLLAIAVLAAGCASQPAVSADPPNASSGDFGVLLMAHGGSPEWDSGVLAAVEPLRDRYAVEVAFGMADAVSIQEAVHRLEARGVQKVGVVRLFVSGESWYDRTEQILGLREGAPARPAMMGHGHGEGHGGHSMEFWRLQTEASFNLSTPGLADAPEMGAILADRAQGLSRNPAREDVLILAHGPGDDLENERWVAKINARADTLRDLRFRRVHVETLREDWPEKRAAAELRIRAFVESAAENGGTAIVIPFRVHGFGPYADVLEGLDYVSDGLGLIPHRNVTRWIEGQITALQDASFRPVIDRPDE